MQHERERQPTDPASDDDDLHAASPAQIYYFKLEIIRPVLSITPVDCANQGHAVAPKPGTKPISVRIFRRDHRLSAIVVATGAVAPCKNGNGAS
jgi:hypothetical protein